MGLISREVIVSMSDIYAVLELNRIQDLRNHWKIMPIRSQQAGIEIHVMRSKRFRGWIAKHQHHGG